MTAFAYLETGTLHETISIAGCHPFRQDNQSVPLGETPEPTLVQRIKAGDFDARQKLITGNLHHVLHNNRHYAPSGAGIFDLLKAGERGLAQALEGFEAGADGSFPAHADLCIRRHIELALKLDLHHKSPGLSRTRSVRHPDAIR